MILNQIELRAEAVLKKLNIGSIPIPVEQIALGYQIRVSRAPNDEFSGMLIRKAGVALIGINNKESLVRQRFSIAHELGHFFLHPNQDAFVDYRDNEVGVVRTRREKQANMFAAALLMPRYTLLKEFRAITREGFSEDELHVLARKFLVSDDAMRYRLINLNLVLKNQNREA